MVIWKKIFQQEFGRSGRILFNYHCSVLHFSTQALLGFLQRNCLLRIFSTKWDYFFLHKCKHQLQHFLSLQEAVIHNQMFRSSEAATRVFYKKAVRTCNFIKKDSNTGFYCEYCELFKNTYFQEHLRTAASANWRARVLSRVNSWKVISSYCFWATIWKFTHDFLAVCFTSFLFVAWY